MTSNSFTSGRGNTSAQRNHPDYMSETTVRTAAPVKLMGLLGEGGMAQVFLGHSDVLGRQVAVKRLRPHLAGLEQARDRMRAEAALTSSVRHDHVVDLIDVCTDASSGDTYLVMELLAGEPLSARLGRGGALPLSETLTVSLQIADAMTEVHRRGIIHRDLKTENVLVGVDPDGALLSKLIDFGVAELAGPGGTLESTTVVGTPESMSPEQAAAGTIDRRSDIYSFGVLMYEMVAGAPPFQCDDLPALMDRLANEAPTPPSQAPGAQKQYVPVALEQLILECLAKSPADRPQSMAEVKARLEQITADYRTLAVAITAATDPSLILVPRRKQALLVVEPNGPVPTPSAVRAIGTNDASHVAAAGRGVGAAARQADPIAPEPAAEPATRPAPTRRRHRLLRAAGTGIVLAAALGVAGVVGSRAFSSSPVPLELPWQR